MDLLAKVFATALVFSQVATTPNDLKTSFDETQDQSGVEELLRAGCAHMRKAFDVEAFNLDDLVETAMEDVDSLSADQAVFRGLNIKQLHLAYRQFCTKEPVQSDSVDLKEVIRFYNKTLASLPMSIDLADLKPPGMTTVLDLEGQPFLQRRSWIAIDQIPLHVQQAFIAAEDKRFYEHKGIDESGLVRAFIANLAAPGRLQGGSTITQQVVKNLLVGTEVSYERKMREMVMASRLEQSTTKQKILELYLNSIYLGRGAWGIGMAAEGYFGKPASELDIAEAALLAGLAKGPSFYNPDRHAERSRDRTAYVLGRMYEDKFIDSESRQKALAGLPVGFISYEGLPQGSHFLDHLAREAKTSVKIDVFAGDAYVVRSTIRPDIQRAAEAALQEGLSRYERISDRVDFRGPEINLSASVERANSGPAESQKPGWQVALESTRLPLYDLHWPAAIVVEEAGAKNKRTVRIGLADGRILPLSLGRVPPAKLKLHDVVRVHVVESKGKAARAELRVRPTVQGAAIVLENQTGRILAMAGGFSYPLSQLNRVTQSQRQPGSSFKPIVYLTALQSGLQPNTLIRDDSITYPPIGGSKRARPEDYWTPKNYDGSEGSILTMRQALEASKNLPTARLLEGIEKSPPQSLDRICKLAQEIKVYKDCIPYYPFVLGAQPVRPIDLAMFYATVANEGLRPNPYSIESISRGDKILHQHEAAVESVNVADQASFYQLKTMLQGVVSRGTARGLSALAPYMAGKTGTTDGENDVWFVGFSNEVTIAVWVGYDNADGQRRTLGSGRTGGNVAIPIFEPIMQAVWTQFPKTALRPASPEARRHLMTPRGERADRRPSKTALLPEYLRRDANGRAVNAQNRLVSRRDQEKLAEAKRKPREESPDTRPAEPRDPWRERDQWFGGNNWNNSSRQDSNRTSGSRWTW